MSTCGISGSVAGMILKATRSSTQTLYDRRWSSFQKWCGENHTDPLEATVPQVLLYLDYLRTVLELSPGTIVGHKTAIVVTLEGSVNRMLRNDLHIKQYIKGLLTTATPRTTVPDWDLSLVLAALSKAPFEPLSSCEMKYLTFKTVFLLAFATAARRSELHALSKTFSRDEKWSYVRLKTVDGFLAKTQSAKDFRSFTIKSLKEFTNTKGLQDECLMCPVRALRYYTNRTLREQDYTHLFVSFKKGYKGKIHPNTISSWLKHCVKLSYELAGKAHPSKVVAHSVRAMSVSWASLKNVGLNQIMESCYWKTANTFISFYLKDLTEIEGEMKKIGKVSVTSTII